MKKQMQGFTLIELMIVVAIIGILAAIALPAYQDYIARSQVTEAVASASAVKTSITEYYASQGACPSDSTYDDSIGGRYTQSAHQTQCSILVTMRNTSPVNAAVKGTTMNMTPQFTNNVINKWTCTTGSMAIKYLPSGCQN